MHYASISSQLILVAFTISFCSFVGTEYLQFDARIVYKNSEPLFLCGFWSQMLPQNSVSDAISCTATGLSRPLGNSTVGVKWRRRKWWRRTPSPAMEAHSSKYQLRQRQTASLTASLRIVSCSSIHPRPHSNLNSSILNQNPLNLFLDRIPPLFSFVFFPSPFFTIWKFTCWSSQALSTESSVFQVESISHTPEIQISSLIIIT